MSEIRWASRIEYYDIANGLQLTKKEAERYYITIKTTKHVEETVETAKYTGYKYTLRTAVYTKHCTTEGKQGSLFTN